MVGAAIEHAAKCAGCEVDFQKLFLEQEADDDDSSSLADVLHILNRTWHQFKASDVANMLNTQGNTSDSITLREFLFPGGRIDQQVTVKGVSKRLGAHVGNPVRHGEETLSLISLLDLHNKVQNFWVKTTE